MTSMFKRLATTSCAVAAALLFGVAVTSTAWAAPPVTGAAFTTTNPLVDGGGHCKNGNEAINCNIYDGKQYVWMNGGPLSAQVGDGTYFFTVLVPGGQGGNQNPNDCTDKNLSDTCPTSGTGAGDAWTNRVFSISGGTVTYPAAGYPGGHDFANNKIRLMPYDDTTNPGGVYIMAICQVPETVSETNPPGVDPSVCKYDAFKVLAADTAAIKACKFDDQNGDGINDAGEPLLPLWKIIGNGVYTGSAEAGQLELLTDETGCVDFTVKVLSGPVTLSEIQQVGWAQTAPNASGTYVGYTGDASGVATLDVPIEAGSEVVVYFGNYNLREGGAIQIVKSVQSEVKYAWNVTKDADKTQVKQSGTTATFNYTVNVSRTDGTWKLSGDITISNSTILTVSGLKVTDTIDNGGTCTIDPKGNGTFDSGTTTVTGVTIGPSTTVEMSYACTFDPTMAGFSLTGKNTVSLKLSDDTEIDVAQVDYDFASNVIDECVNVTDSVYGALGTACVGDANPKSFTYALERTGTAGTCTKFDNTATFTTTDSGATGSASKTVEVCVGKDPTVSKTVTPAFKRTYTWNITKAVDRTRVEQSSLSPDAVFNYTVVASQTGFTDSEWQVTGSISVANPNDWQDIVVNVSDAIDNGGSCVVTGGANVTVPMSGSVTATYTCTYASPTSSAFTNTATATWDQAAYYTPGSSASGTASGAFTTPTSTVNKTINVTDTFAGALGTLTATDSTPYASATYTYARTVPIPASGCVSYDNTATITETGQSASQSVTVCRVPLKTGALTMGFWQNPNGQGIIKTGASTAGVCNSGTWLRQYAPFQDLSSTATCLQVATYVTNVIKAANAAGASMNAMLKAQMLATSLDVYFSDPALGLNKINAPAPIGGVTIDLTMVCKNIGSCTIYENVSSSFNGATSLTVSQMLAYAASRSNVGGSDWYNQVKNGPDSQELAKDAFDAINNQKVFAP